MDTRSFSIVPQGRFSLRESATFGFGQRVAFGQRVETDESDESDGYDGVMRLAFCMDGYREQVGVEVRQDADGVHCVVHGEADLEAVRAQVARVLSLEHDGRGFDAIGDRDPVIGRLQAVAPGLRPPLFYSPYEAAAWSIISARRPATQMAQVRARLGDQYGRQFELAGEQLAALPTPEALLAVEEFPGLPAEKITRLHGVARAALDGVLDVARLKEAGPEQAQLDVQQIKGIGAFYSSLITVRAMGWTDILPVQEKIARALTAEFYDLGAEPTDEDLAAVAENWRPFRTWVVVLIRAASGRLPAGDQPGGVTP